MTVKYSDLSLYSNTPQNSWYLGHMNFRPIPALDTDLPLTIKAGYANRPDLLSYELYATTRLWWVFAMRNPNLIKDPIFDLVEGVTIFVTNKDALLGLLNV